jgi:hypothetical protein
VRINPAFFSKADADHLVFFIASDVPFLVALINHCAEEATRAEIFFPRKFGAVHCANLKSFWANNFYNLIWAYIAVTLVVGKLIFMAVNR